MCFGVRDALKAIADINTPQDVTIHGELVHNEKVLAGLHSRGFAMAAEARRTSLPVTDTVLITAHGVSEKERRRLLDAGKTLIDTTCPLVERAHDAAQSLQDAGCHVLVIGKPGHVEVRGIVEDLASFDIIEDLDDVRRFPHARLGIVCQTTTQEAEARRIIQAIRDQNPRAEVRHLDTICHPTKEHQRSLERLLEQVQAVVVVGGRNSNNTRELARRCRERGLAAYHVQDASDLRPDWFAGLEVVGLTAGTSTLDDSIQEVEQWLLGLGEGDMAQPDAHLTVRHARA